MSADAECALYTRLFICGEGWNEVTYDCCSLHVCQSGRHMKCVCRVGEIRNNSTGETPHERLCRRSHAL